MSTAYLGEIRMFGFNFAPKGWAFCNGQLMSIQQNTALFAILGTTFGGNGQTNFQLPNLQSRVPLHMGVPFGGGQFDLGQIGGEETHSLTINEFPAHSHLLRASNDAADADNPVNGILAQTSGFNLYSTVPGTPVTLAPSTIQSTGSSLPHTNVQPYLVVNFCIALIGIFPSRN